MRVKSLLALAAAAVTVAGCSIPPSSQSIDRSTGVQAFATQSVKLSVQGLAQGDLSASRLTLDPKAYFVIPAPYVKNLLGSLITRSESAPAGGQSLAWLSGRGTDFFRVYREAEATHALYRLAVTPEEIRNYVTAFLWYSEDQPPRQASLDVLPGSVLAIQLTEAEASGDWWEYWPLLKISNTAPASFRLVLSENGEEFYVTTESWEFTHPRRRLHLDSDLVLTTNDGKPLSGITAEALALRELSLRKQGESEPHGIPLEDLSVTLSEQGNGRYTVGIDIYLDPRHLDDLQLPDGRLGLQEVAIELELGNVPQFREVEF